MTIIAAIKRRDEVWIGSDSFFGDEESRILDSEDSSKIIQFRYFKVGFAGAIILRDVLYATKWNSQIKNNIDATNFAKRVFAMAKKMVLEGLVDKDTWMKELEDIDFLIVTPSKIFHVEDSTACQEFKRYRCIGIAHKQCSTAIEALYDIPIENNQVIKAALSATCRLSNFCSEPLTIMKVTK
jgi:ATP-dependent protease HslVU (ClpYQ) peptidase subunit